MRVKDLKELIAHIDDDAVIVRSIGDHSYRECDFELTTGLYDGHSDEWSEDYGESLTPESNYCQRIAILIVQ